jgi:hypothetical protein
MAFARRAFRRVFRDEDRGSRRGGGRALRDFDAILPTLGTASRPRPLRRAVRCRRFSPTSGWGEPHRRGGAKAAGDRSDQHAGCRDGRHGRHSR